MNMAGYNEFIEKLINENEMVLVYFGSETCSVCCAVKPKVEEILKDYPKIKSLQVDVEKSLQVAAEYNIFTIPAILVFIEGKEIIREARHISMQDIDNKIKRYYSMLF
jgi:thioredoxin-like negative regulator of GroEL